jgi:hypothetical protein
MFGARQPSVLPSHFEGRELVWIDGGVVCAAIVLSFWPRMKLLTAFPDAFYPLVIVTADRREEHPKSRGDLLASSGSPADLMYLPALGLRKDVQIVSDKTFVLLKQDELKARFGHKNLLVVGSPDTNLLARIINGGSLFRFNVKAETLQKLGLQEKIVDQHPFDRVWLQVYTQVSSGRSFEQCLASFGSHAQGTAKSQLPEVFADVLRRYKKTGLRSLKRLLRELAVPGFVDPMEGAVHGFSLPRDRDFGVVSLARNPFSPDGQHVAILVGGIHLPGTAQGVRALADRTQFEAHPLGGVFRVEINVDAAWPDRVDGIFMWESDTYTMDRALKVLRQLSKPQPRSTDDPALQQLAGQLLEMSAKQTAKRQLRAFLSIELSKETGRLHNAATARARGIARVIESAVAPGELSCENPYSGGFYGDNYVNEILDHFRQAAVVVHDITGYSPGVLVEIGFSVGLGTKRLLIWDLERGRLPKLPPLLDRTHVHEIGRPAKGKGARILREKLKALLFDKSKEVVKPPDHDPAMGDSSVLVFAPPHRKAQLEKIVGQLTQRQFNPKTEHNVVGNLLSENRLEGCRRAIQAASTVIVVYDEKYLDGLLVLGMAQANERKIVLLRHTDSEAPSVFAGSEYSWHEQGNFDDVLDRALVSIAPRRSTIPSPARGRASSQVRRASRMGGAVE